MPVAAPAAVDAAPAEAAPVVGSARTEDAAAPPTPSAAASSTPDAGARAPRPVVVRAFRKISGSTDAVAPRAPKPDGEPDAVFELVVEGDVVGLALWNANASMSAVTELASPAPAPPPSTTPLLSARPSKPPAWGIMKHVPALYVFEGGALVSDDEGHLALPDRAGARTLRLHTWRPHDGGGKGPWRLVVLAADGHDREAPSLP